MSTFSTNGLSLQVADLAVGFPRYRRQSLLPLLHQVIYAETVSLHDHGLQKLQAICLLAKIGQYEH